MSKNLYSRSLRDFLCRVEAQRSPFAEVRRFLQVLKGRRDRAVFMLMLRGGLMVSCHHVRHTISNLKVQRDYFKTMQVILQRTGVNPL